MKEHSQENFWPLISKFGLIYALLSVALNLVLYITSTQLSLKYLNTALNFVIVFGSIFWGMQTVKNEIHDGFSSYGQAFKAGILITVAASVLLTVYFFVYFSYIDVDFIDNMAAESKKQLIENGATEDEIEAQMKVLSYVKSPWVLNLGGFLGNFFYGLIASLILAFIVKREDPDAAYKSLEG
jgi:hypothetical protein